MENKREELSASLKDKNLDAVIEGLKTQSQKKLFPNQKRLQLLMQQSGKGEEECYRALDQARGCIKRALRLINPQAKKQRKKRETEKEKWDRRDKVWRSTW